MAAEPLPRLRGTASIAADSISELCMWGRSSRCSNLASEPSDDRLPPVGPATLCRGVDVVRGLVTTWTTWKATKEGQRHRRRGACHVVGSWCGGGHGLAECLARLDESAPRSNRCWQSSTLERRLVGSCPSDQAFTRCGVAGPNLVRDRYARGGKPRDLTTDCGPKSLLASACSDSEGDRSGLGCRRRETQDHAGPSDFKWSALCLVHFEGFGRARRGSPRPYASPSHTPWPLPACDLSGSSESAGCSSQRTRFRSDGCSCFGVRA